MRDEIKHCIHKRIVALLDGYRQNIGIVGPEGIGKTQLLTSVFQEISGRPHVIPIYIHAASIDLENLIEKWSVNLLRGIFISQSVAAPEGLSSLFIASDPIAPKTVEKIRHLKKTVGRDRLSNLRDLFSLTGILAEETGKRVVLMIDEIQELQRVSDADVFSALGKEIMLEKNTLFLVSSSDMKSAHEIFKEKLSLLFSNFEVLEMGCFSRDEAMGLMEERLSLSSLNESERIFLLHLTDGFPLYLDLILRRLQQLVTEAGRTPLFSTEGDEQRLELIGQCLHQELFVPTGRLNLLFEKRVHVRIAQIRDDRLAIKCLIAVSEGYRKSAEISAYTERKGCDVKKMLQKLEDESLIQRNGSFYYMEDTLFGFWLRESLTRRYQFSVSASWDEEVKIKTRLRELYTQFTEESSLGYAARIERLFKRFHHDIIEIESKRERLPAFNEFTSSPAHSDNPIWIARSKDVRWALRVCEGHVQEKDITAFMLDLKQLKKKMNKKILISLTGVEQNAKLLAHELKIQIWNQQELQLLAKIFQLPEFLRVQREDHDESLMGALAQSVYSA